MYEIIKKSPEFQLLFNSNKRFSGNFFTVLVHYETDLSSTRIGIITGKKVGKAVVRNKIKRRIKAYINIRTDMVCNLKRRLVIIAKKQRTPMTWNELVDDLDSVFLKLVNGL